MATNWHYVLLASLLLHFLLALLKTKCVGFKKSTNDDRYFKMVDNENSSRSGPWRSNP